MDAINNFFSVFADAVINALTIFLNTYSGTLQGLMFLILAWIFMSAMLKCFQAVRRLAPVRSDEIEKRNLFLDHGDQTPLAISAASFFVKSRSHYQQAVASKEILNRQTPPDEYVRDAAFQYSKRFFEEKYLEPISMTANLLPPLGFIGTIIGMAAHFITSTGGIDTQATASGIAMALYTTLIALAGFTMIEFIKKICYTASQKRIAEGLDAVAENGIPETRTAPGVQFQIQGARSGS